MRRLTALLALLLPLTACESVEDGWVFSPFEGPAYDLELGLSPEAAEAEGFVLTTTWISVDRGARGLFDAHVEAIQEELAAGPEGLIGVSFASKIVGDEHRTLTVWRDEEALLDFVLGEAHVAAMGDASLIADPERAVRTGRWAVAPEALPPVWSEVIERLEVEGREAAY
ncbi:MAG: DUF3291 domain-containing protein [Alphaproteobacteria bacterium]|nr:DUF3291 domain-containing protein [Alphaproteobacteria bacterium]MCB9796449.1 DUF3291 domain-containing protein [Alphaproteobacteria bacterium]